MTQKHFTVLADELAQDKFFYDSLIAYHEKLDRMIKYCQDSNPRFNLESFTARIIDVNGKIVSQKKIDISSDSATLDVSDLNTGNYVIQLINSKKQYAQKIIKI